MKIKDYINEHGTDTSLATKAAFLMQHSFDTVEIAGTLYIKEEYINRAGEHGHEWVDITSWDLIKLSNWMGY